MAEELRILALNVWFDFKLRAARTQALVALIQSAPLHACCFQEVVPEVAQMLRRALPDWSCSDPGDGSTVQPYGVMSLVSPGVAAEFTFHSMPTNMCRRLLVSNLDGRLIVGNVHLESLDNQSTREQQLCVCSRVLGASANAVLVGDFNFDSERNFKAPHAPLDNLALAKCLPGFVDVWPELRADPGLTFNSAINPYIGMHEMMRYDRVLAQLVEWQPSAIELFGREPVDHLVELTAREQDLLNRPPTPPRPSLRPCMPIWGDGVDDMSLESMTTVTPASPPQSGEPRESAVAETPPGTPRTPTKARGKLFLSDHFGLLVTLAHVGPEDSAGVGASDL
eukprot:TRINITY_DN46105_c0_g1_i1.p1 TRINITY_DN46105_c0_g1~~TRINITY_DN46105_c0_g1_i1.p1  ORF type:complete len:351 (-),score=36.91 TRINITY_DN46105_c0_g1_i1:22-1035(-)